MAAVIEKVFVSGASNKPDKPDAPNASDAESKKKNEFDQLVSERLENLWAAHSRDVSNTTKRIETCKADIVVSSQEVMALKEQLKDSRSQHESAVELLTKSEQKLKDLEANPPTLKAATEFVQRQMENRMLPGMAESAMPPPADPGATTPIAEIGLTEAVNQKLADANPPIKTVCDLERCIRDGKLQYVKGVGPNKIDQITDLLMEWRANNPVPVADEIEPDTEGDIFDPDFNEDGDDDSEE